MSAFRPGPFTPIHSIDEFEKLLTDGRFVLFKHSPICGTSYHAYEEVERYAEDRTHPPVYIVDVVGQRELSQQIASRLGVPHKSPQVLIIDNGTVVWTKSHYAISQTALAETAA